jgi:hypothetical protein
VSLNCIHAAGNDHCLRPFNVNFDQINLPEHETVQLAQFHGLFSNNFL